MPPADNDRVPTLRVWDSFTLTPQPHVNSKRETSESDVLATLSITRDYTTYTTIILLAGTAAPSIIPSITAGFPTSTAPAATSSSIIGTEPVKSSSTDPSSSVIVGRIVGSILGALAFVGLLWICLYRPGFSAFFPSHKRRRSKRRRSKRRYRGDHSSGSRSEGSEWEGGEAGRPPAPGPPPPQQAQPAHWPGQGEAGEAPGRHGHAVGARLPRLRDQEVRPPGRAPRAEVRDVDDRPVGRAP